MFLTPHPEIDSSQGHLGKFLRVAPVFHNRLAFSRFIRKALMTEDWRPDVIACELAPSIGVAALRGLQHERPGPLWIGKKIEAYLQRTPFHSLSHRQHTQHVIASTVRVLLDARRIAFRQGFYGYNCRDNEWLGNIDKGFEPFVVIFRQPQPRREYYVNVVMPDRIYYASEGFGGTRTMIRPGAWVAELDGRAWYTPPFYSDDGRLSRKWKRAEWIRAAGADRAPRTRSEDEPDSNEDWNHRLLRRALAHCQQHVLYIAPADMQPPADLLESAAEAGRQIIHVPIDSVDQTALRIVASDELEYSKVKEDEVDDPEIEAYSLHSGDAFTTALRIAVDRHIDVAFVDRELTPYELRRCDDRPGGVFVEDIFLLDEGMQGFYERVHVTAEATRVDDVDLERERHMAANLLRFVDQRKNVLFVCGAAHWDIVQRLLCDSNFRYEIDTQASDGADLFCAGPYGWAVGSGEIPRTLSKYQTLRRKGLEDRFRPILAYEELQKTIVDRLIKSSHSTSSDIQMFRRFLNRLCNHAGLVIPRLYQLLTAARSCLEKRGQEIVEQESMKFLESCPNDVPKISLARSDGDRVTIRIGMGPNTVTRSRFGGQRVVIPAYPSEDDEGRRDSCPTGTGIKYSQQDWHILMRDMMLIARRFAAPRVPVFQAAPMTGILQGQLDGRATARAYTRGDTRAYQKLRTRDILNSLNEFEGFDPVVWVFEEVSGGCFEPMFLEEDPYEYHAVVVAEQTKTRGGETLRMIQIFGAFIPAIADTDSVLRSRIRRWLRQGNNALIPRGEEFDKVAVGRSWRRCSASESTLVVALDHCREHVICVSDKQPSERVRSEFRKKHKRLLHVDRSLFDQDALLNFRSLVLKSRE